MLGDIGLEAPGEALADRIEALGRQSEQVGEPRQAAGCGAKARLALVEQAPQGAGLAPGEVVDRGHQFRTHRHGTLGGGGGRRRAFVGGVVDQGPVGLVADGGNERDVAGGGRAHHVLVVEAPQVLEAAAAPGDDDQVRPRDRSTRFERIEAADGGGHFRAGALPLDPDRPDQDMGREAVGEAVQDVADDRAGGRGDNADDPGQERQELLARLVEQTFRASFLRRSSSSAISAPTPAGSIDSMTIWYFDWPGKVVSLPVTITSRPCWGWILSRWATPFQMTPLRTALSSLRSR